MLLLQIGFKQGCTLPLIIRYKVRVSNIFHTAAIVAKDFKYALFQILFDVTRVPEYVCQFLDEILNWVSPPHVLSHALLLAPIH